ncbi:hypothetical protein LV779_35120 [Streptomyces thinghirensis]|nr:hypothetical protein [Streptomyces thinghirensis]
MVSRDEYGTEVVLAGAMTAYTAGALGGALLIARWRPRSPGRAALAGLAAYGFAPLSLIFPVHPVVVMAAYAVAGIGIELFNVPWFTAAQREVAPDKLARVSSLDFPLSLRPRPGRLSPSSPPPSTPSAPRRSSRAARSSASRRPPTAALVPSARTFSAAPGRSDAHRRPQRRTHP